MEEGATDLYERTMLQAYWREGMTQEAVFSLCDRHLPAGHNDFLACGLGEALRHLGRRRCPAGGRGT